MKKSRIIVPAMALIAFTSLASIAGSVAWFTASRQVTINAGTYTVVKTSTNLEFEVNEGIGTSVNAAKTIVDLGSNKLTDGSFNHNTSARKFFWPDGTGTNFASGLYVANTKDGLSLTDAKADPSKLVRETLSASEKVYTAVTFEVSFTMSFGATAGNYGLFLNRSLDGESKPKSKFEATNPIITATGFRMAFVPNGATADVATSAQGHTQNTLVFAGLQTAANAKYISTAAGTMEAGATAYTATERFIDSSYHEDLPSDGAVEANITDPEHASYRKDLLGVFKFYNSATVTLNYTVVAWFEGTDPNIVNQDAASKYQSVAATLVFDTVKLS